MYKLMHSVRAYDFCCLKSSAYNFASLTEASCSGPRNNQVTQTCRGHMVSLDVPITEQIKIQKMNTRAPEHSKHFVHRQ